MRYKIGEFSKLSKVTVKTLRFYDEEGVLKPESVDRWNGYRYYSERQLETIGLIRECRDVGLSLDDIKGLLNDGGSVTILEAKRDELVERASHIDRLIRRMRSMASYNAEIRDLPGCVVAFRKGRIDRYSDLTQFVFGFQAMCLESNPGIECTEDDYCFVQYDDEDYREKDIGLIYAQSVKRAGTPSGEIGFREYEPTRAVCVKHLGPYANLVDAYAFVMSYIEDEGLKMTDSPRECYIHGPWDRESPEEYETEIQVSVE